MYELHTIYQILSFNAVHTNKIILDKHTLEMKMTGVWYTKLTETLGGNFYFNFIQTQLKLYYVGHTTTYKPHA